MQQLAAAQPTSDSGHAGVAIFMRNVTNRAMAEEAFRDAQHRALHDPLTGLPNRVLLLDRLGQACARLRRSGGRLLVMFVDLDRLKQVNDTWGHEMGDDLLIQVGRRLDQALRPDDTVARLGGDEFVVVCPDIGDSQMHRELPARLLETLARPVPLGRATVGVTASIGVVVAGDTPTPPTCCAAPTPRCTAPNAPAATAGSAERARFRASTARLALHLRHCRCSTRRFAVRDGTARAAGTVGGG